MHLVVTPANSGRAYSGEVGDSYVLTVTIFKPTLEQKTSTGTISSKAGSKLTLKPSNADASDTFAITLDGSGEMVTLQGTITYTNAVKESVPLSPIAAVSTSKEYPFDGIWHCDYGEGKFATLVMSKNTFTQIWNFDQNNDTANDYASGPVVDITADTFTLGNIFQLDGFTGEMVKDDNVSGKTYDYVVTDNGNTLTTYEDKANRPQNSQVFSRLTME